MSSWEKQAVEHSQTTRESIRGPHQPVKDPFQFECLQSPDLPVKHLYPFEFPPPPPRPEACALRRPLPVVESRPFPSSGTSCRGCFRPSESQPLSDLQLLDYPWGGYPGPGEVFAHKFAFETGELPFDEDSFYWPAEDRFDNTYELVTKFLRQVRQSKGYDVDCHPPSQLNSPFLPIRDLEWLAPDNEYYQKRFLEPTLVALQSINEKMRRSYELVKIEKAVETAIMLTYLTFTAKERVANAPVLTFQAIVNVPFGWAPVGVLFEWRIKSDVAAAATSGA